MPDRVTDVVRSAVRGALGNHELLSWRHEVQHVSGKKSAEKVNLQPFISGSVDRRKVDQ